MQTTNITNINNNLLTVIDNLILIFSTVKKSGTLKKSQVADIQKRIESLHEHVIDIRYLLDRLSLIEYDLQQSPDWLNVGGQYNVAIHTKDDIINRLLEALRMYLKISDILISSH